MSSANNRKKNNTNSKRNSNLASKLGLGSFTKDFPEVGKMGTKIQQNFMSVSNNKYFLYVMLFLGISTVLGFLSVKNFNAVVLFVVVAFAMRYFTKNMGIIMLVAVILSNIISVKSTIEGMKDENGEKAKRRKRKTLKKEEKDSRLQHLMSRKRTKAEAWKNRPEFKRYLNN